MGTTIALYRVSEPRRIRCKLACAFQAHLRRLLSRRISARTVEWPWAALLLPLMLANCTSESRVGEPESRDASIRSHELVAGLGCKPSDGLLQCLRLNEPIAAERHQVALARRGGRLCISSTGSKVACLQDFDGYEHLFLERAKDHFVVVETDAAGGYTVLLLDAMTGLHSRVDNRPLFAPAAPYFATVSYDTDAGFLPKRVAIWDATSNELVYAVDRFASGTGPIAIRWSALSRLQVIYSRTQYSPSIDGDTGTFDIWRNEDSTWNDDYPSSHKL